MKTRTLYKQLKGDLMKKTKEFILREIADEYLLIPTGKTTETFNGIISLSDTAAFIYEHLEEADTFETLVHMIVSEYDVDEETAVKDAVIFINQLLANEMIELSNINENW